MANREAGDTTESWLVAMDEIRELAANTCRKTARLARLTGQLVGEEVTGELASSADSAEGWAGRTEGQRDAKSLDEYFETTRNCLNEAVWILDNARTVLREERPEMLGKPPAWA